MEFIKKNKLIISIVLAFGIGFSVSPKGISEAEYNSVKENYEKVEKELQNSKTEVKNLESKVKEAEPWFNMKEEEQKKLEEEQAKLEEERRIKEEEEKRKQEALANSKIGERIIYTMGSEGTFALTIDSVSTTSQRNQFADEKFDHVFEVKYTVENISMDELDFFLDNQAEFYDAEGYKCSSYPNSTGAGTYDIAKGKKASGKEFYGVNGSKYLEMDLGGTIYKWQL